MCFGGAIVCALRASTLHPVLLLLLTLVLLLWLRSVQRGWAHSTLWIMAPNDHDFPVTSLGLTASPPQGFDPMPNEDLFAIMIGIHASSPGAYAHAVWAHPGGGRAGPPWLLTVKELFPRRAHVPGTRRAPPPCACDRVCVCVCVYLCVCVLCAVGVLWCGGHVPPFPSPPPPPHTHTACVATGALTTYDPTLPGQIATTIHRPDTGYTGLYNFFDPDNVLSSRGGALRAQRGGQGQLLPALGSRGGGGHRRWPCLDGATLHPLPSPALRRARLAPSVRWYQAGPASCLHCERTNAAAFGIVTHDVLCDPPLPQLPRAAPRCPALPRAAPRCPALPRAAAVHQPERDAVQRGCVPAGASPQCH